jgi:aromatic-L-amino-acid/L-tryptophan decarboxylase
VRRQYLQRRRRLRISPRPDDIGTFCLRIPGVDHRATLDALADEGTALLCPARLDGRSGIRACVINYRTAPADVGLVPDRLSELARDRAGSR